MVFKIHGICHINEIFYVFDNNLYPKSLVICSKIVLLLKCMILEAIYIIISGYYHIHCNRCPIRLQNPTSDFIKYRAIRMYVFFEALPLDFCTSLFK